MAENSKIEWCDHTVNLWWGCAKVHIGCKNCYAEYLSDKRLNNNLWGENTGRRRIKSSFNDLFRYQKAAKLNGRPLKVFCGSMMDIFEDSKSLIDPVNVKDYGDINSTGDLRSMLFQMITLGIFDNLIFLFLTKRPRNIWKMIPEEWSHGRHNVWFGTSVSDMETTKYADQLSNSLKHQNLFLSIEPQVGPIDEIDLSGIGWVIQGGESGHKKRPFDVDWAYKMKQICYDYDVPYFFKQIDKITPIPNDLMVRKFPIGFYL